MKAEFAMVEEKIGSEKEGKKGRHKSKNNAKEMQDGT